ncbi:venom allergen-like protein vap-2 [Aphelenchoides avenae]|nr:venom allergen-like protein vap-2 [Aphelenchus avenae]
MTEEARRMVTDRHNLYRSGMALGYGLNSDGKTYLPKGKSYYKLNYDLALESIAQNWANGCVWQHSSSQQRQGAGENLFKWTGVNKNATASVYDASYYWWKEFNDFGLNPNLNLTLQDGAFTYVVCNYQVAGNYINQFVYEAGNPCQGVSSEMTHKFHAI